MRSLLRSRCVARAARSAAVASLERLADRCGVGERSVEETLFALDGRGGCARGVAAAARRGSAAAGCVAQCPPGTARAVGSAVAAAAGAPRTCARAGSAMPRVSMSEAAARGAGHLVASDLQRPPAVLAGIVAGGGSAAPAAAANPACAPAVLAAAFVGAVDCDDDEIFDGILDAAASNPSLPRPLIVVAARQKYVGYLAASNPACPAELLLEMSESSDTSTLLSVARNPNTPPEALARLAGAVQGSDSAQPGGYPGDPPPSHIAADVAQNPSCEAWLLEVLAGPGGGGPRIFDFLVGNPACPRSLFDKIIGSCPGIAIGAVVRSPHADAGMLDRAARTPDDYLRLLAGAPSELFAIYAAASQRRQRCCCERGRGGASALSAERSHCHGRTR